MAVKPPTPKFFTFRPGVQARGPNQLRLKPQQTLAFRPGRGYYAKPKPAVHPYAPPPRRQPLYPMPPYTGGAGPNANDPGYTPPDTSGDGGGDSSGGGYSFTPYNVDPAFNATSAADLEKQAEEMAAADLRPQQDEIRRQQGLAARAAAADEEKITGLATTSAKLMGELAPGAQTAYTDAATLEGQLGQGLATGAAQDVAAGVAGDKAFMEAQGQSGGPGPDTAGLHDAIYNLNGRIPGDTFAEQGANAAAWGLAQPPIALNAGREQLSARMVAAKQEGDDYAQQLIQVAAQFPDRKKAALQQLNQYELDKANYRLSIQQANEAGTLNEANYNEGVRKDNADIANTNSTIAARTAATESQKRQDALAARSERAQERAAGLTTKRQQAAAAAVTARANAQMKYKWAGLAFQKKKEADRAKAAVDKGKIIDVAASKLLGHVVYKDGSQDTSIKVQKAANTAQTKTQTNRANAVSTARVGSFNYATKLLGSPVKAPKGAKGAYLARQGAKPTAVFPPAYPGGPRTTNNPKYAAHTSGAANYLDAQQKVWAEIDGDGLMARYGYSKEQVMAIVRTALARAGWKRK